MIQSKHRWKSLKMDQSEVWFFILITHILYVFRKFQFTKIFLKASPWNRTHFLVIMSILPYRLVIVASAETSINHTNCIYKTKTVFFHVFIMKPILIQSLWIMIIIYKKKTSISFKIPEQQFILCKSNTQGNALLTKNLQTYNKPIPLSRKLLYTNVYLMRST